MQNILLASTSTLYGGEYLAYLKEELKALFAGIEEIVFIPYARPGGISHYEYTAKAASYFETIGIRVKGLHTFEDPIQAIQTAKGFFTGGGNTFLLVKTMHELGLMSVLKQVVVEGVPYLGASAGSNLAGMNMRTTNDMPIVYPPSFDTMGWVPFNLNPHYLDPIEGLQHNGETRETRIMEFLTQNDTPVVGLREGGWIRIKGTSITLEGEPSARIFEQGKAPIELASGNKIEF